MSTARMCEVSPVEEELAAFCGAPARIKEPGWVHVERLPRPCLGALHQQRCQRITRGQDLHLSASHGRCQASNPEPLL